MNAAENVTFSFKIYLTLIIIFCVLHITLLLRPGCVTEKVGVDIQHYSFNK